MKALNLMPLVAISVMLISILTSCGSTNTGGGAVFTTVNASASADSAKNPLLSDLAKWSGTACASGSTYTISNDLVSFAVVSTVNISSGTGSPLMLQKATITLSPADTLTPALPPLYSTYYQYLTGATVPAGSTLSVPIEIGTHNIKSYLGNILVCNGSNTIYSYNATIVIDAVESAIGTSKPITAGMTVRFADFSD